MDQTKEELKLMQSHPNLYIANYFSDLKRDIDLTFFCKEDEKTKYIEIINKIEEIEKDYYKKSKRFNTFDQEIESVKNMDNQSIDDLKYRIEMKLFQNKSILFIKDYGFSKKTFLLIINDEYLRKTTFNNMSHQYEYFNREQLIAFLLKNKLANNILNQNIVYLNIEARDLSEIVLNFNFIRKIDSFTFNGFINLKKINFNNNHIKNLPINIFNGLTSLEEIDFSFNKLAKINPNIFNGLIKLKVINFSYNNIKELHENILNGLINLEFITFTGNQIKEIKVNLFNGFKSIKYIYFSSNQIKEIHPNTFGGLNNLKHLYICNNQIQNLGSFLFSDNLMKLEEARFDI